VDTADGLPNHESQDSELPFVDEHTIRIDASRELVWTALQRYVAASLRLAAGHPLTKILGTQPPAGFEVSESTPAERLILVGCHRFSRYMLAFELIDANDGTIQLRANTYAKFPGVRGRVYRVLVIGTRAHVIATNHILRGIRRLTIRLTAAGDPTA
jgi:hypothetical protein